jgi:hypothetical protein
LPPHHAVQGPDVHEPALQSPQLPPKGPPAPPGPPGPGPPPLDHGPFDQAPLVQGPLVQGPEPLQVRREPVNEASGAAVMVVPVTAQRDAIFWYVPVWL